MKLAKIIVLGMLLVSILAFSASAVQIPKTCSDSDSGHDLEAYFTGGYVDSTPPIDNRDYDHCFGNEEETVNHEKLREYFCADSETNDKEDIDCLDYNAVCVEDAGGDHCGCAENTHFDKNEQMCVRNQTDVPEFGFIGAILATILSGLAVAVLRKR